MADGGWYHHVCSYSKEFDQRRAKWRALTAVVGVDEGARGGGKRELRTFGLRFRSCSHAIVRDNGAIFIAVDLAEAFGKLLFCRMVVGKLVWISATDSKGPNVVFLLTSDKC